MSNSYHGQLKLKYKLSFGWVGWLVGWLTILLITKLYPLLPENEQGAYVCGAKRKIQEMGRGAEK